MTGLRLYMLRHAKAVVAAPGLADFERPLAKAGWTAVAEIGAVLLREGYRPERILCSSSRRTRDTLAGLLPFLAHDVEARLVRAIYDADDEGLLGLIATSGHARSLMVIGHNPAIERLASTLAGPGSDAQVLGRMRGRFPTGALAVLDCDGEEWPDLLPGTGRLVAFHVPGGG